ncbi:STAS domain-containing protein [Thermoactinospora rubra]|uniref:STAS domain-containing protein n=1 Tax=Thermoactinospora rubra TaxID=1088767 RepID=UPI000A0F5FE8|nr:STAS domain-containing protein [Thermoactinospora rubra]
MLREAGGSVDRPDGDSPLRVTVEQITLGIMVSLRGELDYATAMLVPSELDQLPTVAGPPRVILDLSELTFCDSSGLMQLLRLWKRLQAAGGALALVGVRGMCARLLQRTALDQLFAMYPSVGEAETALAGNTGPP